MQAKEIASQSGACCQVIDIRGGGSRPAGNRRKGRLAGLDRKFKELDQNGRMHVVHMLIGYSRAMSDGIRAGRCPREDEISRIVRMIEDSINEARKGGMI